MIAFWRCYQNQEKHGNSDVNACRTLRKCKWAELCVNGICTVRAVWYNNIYCVTIEKCLWFNIMLYCLFSCIALFTAIYFRFIFCHLDDDGTDAAWLRPDTGQWAQCRMTGAQRGPLKRQMAGRPGKTMIFFNQPTNALAHRISSGQLAASLQGNLEGS